MKKSRIPLIILALIILSLFLGKIYAADVTRNLGAQNERPFNPISTYQYGVKGQEDGSTLYYTLVKIYDDNNRDFSKYTKPIYCIRGGKGFGVSKENPYEDVSKSPIEYIQAERSEMHYNANEVISKYKELYNVDLDRNENINEKTVNIYNAILWILDEAYLPKDKVNSENEAIYSSLEYKQELLDKVGVPRTQQEEITDNDIEIMQQLAVWYFTNYDEQKANINPTVSQSTMFPAQFLSINRNNNISSEKENNLNRIYQYFIYGAINNSSTYIINEETGSRTKKVEKNEFDKAGQLTITSNDSLGLYSYYQIGPVKIKNNLNDRNGSKELDSTNIVLYDAEGNSIPKFYLIPEDEVLPGMKSYNTIYRFVDKDGNEATSLQTGIEYYIRFYKFFEKGSETPDFITDNDKYDISKISIKMTSLYMTSTADFMYAKNEANNNQAVVEIDKEKISEGDEITTKVFDLALRKFISSIDGKILSGEETRIPKINTNTLINGTNNDRGIKEYTATYIHPKNAVRVEKGDKVIYTIRVYNEGEIDGTATEVTDYLPDGLELVPNSESTINTKYKWTTTDGKTVKTDYLKNTIIKAFDKEKTSEEEGWQKAAEGISGLYYSDLQIECRVVADISAEDIKLRNIAEITADTGEDRDSIPNNVDKESYNPPEDNSTYQQDDDDYEDLVLKAKEFDLSLRKYITEINGSKLEGDKERTPKIDTNELTKREATTAKYVHPKNAVTVKKGDIVTYKIRVYNEGERDGYATKVTDYLPEGLGFLPEYTKNSIWSIPKKVDETTGNEVLPEGVELKVLVGENGLYKNQESLSKTKIKLEDFKDPITGEIPKDYSKINIVTGEKLEVSTSELKDKIIKAYKSEKAEGDQWQQSTNDEKDGLFYEELEITCIVLKENTYPGILKNVAEITAAEDAEGNEIKNVGDDRDSEPNNVYEDGEHTPGVEKDGYTPGEQDDDDYEPLQLKYFDLALRKFITKVDERAPETSREPEVDVSTLIEGTYNRNGKLENTATYKHPKEPLLVKNGSNVEYTIRVYNEGTEDGYAYEIADDIPEGLIYDPENETNKEYGWEMYREITEGEKDLDEKDIIEYNNKKYIKTTKAEEATMIRTRYLENKIIKAFNPETKELSYEDVKVMFTVYETENIDPDRIIINEAQITEDSGDDEDSTPNKWQDEDDEDIEKVRIPIFDLSLLKWVTKTTVTVDGKTTVTETGFKPNTGKTETTGIRSNETAEPIAKVEVDRKKLNKTTVKFTYKIRVTNEGEIEGFATKITDFIPEGLEFREEDNKAYGWVKEGENKVTTRGTETVLLQPGESTEVEIVFTWKNGTNNLGLKTNIAEITEDYNDYDTDDIDSTPNNKKDPYEKEQEDDDDFALVILSIKTGKGASYVVFTTAMVTLLAGGIYLVKRYVLTY